MSSIMLLLNMNGQEIVVDGDVDLLPLADLVSAEAAATRALIISLHNGDPVPDPVPDPIPDPVPVPDPDPSSPPVVGGVTIFPATNPWNRRIDNLPVHSTSAAVIARLAGEMGSSGIHRDFGRGFGIPFNVMAPGTPLVNIVFKGNNYDANYSDESDQVPAPFLPKSEMLVEDGDDRHVLAISTDGNSLYESYNSRWNAAAQEWRVSQLSRFDLDSDDLRPIGWTAGDAAGLPIFAGLVRWDEVQSGRIKHALRFTVDDTRNAFCLPATHLTTNGDDGPDQVPMGGRFRLRPDFDISTFTPMSKVILTALKEYGMICADNGGQLFISGEPHDGWMPAQGDDIMFEELKGYIGPGVKASDFEMVDTGPVFNNYSDAEAWIAANPNWIQDIYG